MTAPVCGDGWPASRLCDLASDFLAARWPDAVIVRELSVGNWGSSMLDIAAITDDAIIGVEIKGDGDSPTRLKLQAASYSKSATHMFLLAAPSIAGRCKAHKPMGWRLLTVAGDRCIDEHAHYLRLDRLPTSAAQLLQALWKEELLLVAASARVVAHRSMRVDQIAEELSELVPLRELRKHVCAALRARDWARVTNANGNRVRLSNPPASTLPDAAPDAGSPHSGASGVDLDTPA